MSTASALKAANGRLKAAKIPARINIKHGHLCLRATLPPKPNSPKTEPFQQRIALGLKDIGRCYKLAEDKARLLGIQIEQGSFSWDEWGATSKAETVAQWVDKFEADFFQRGGTKTTWTGDYLQSFRKLPPEAPLTLPLLLAVA
ncbi:MAG: integrase, partial [Cyanobacteria bacterium P01_D01_bin.128]